MIKSINCLDSNIQQINTKEICLPTEIMIQIFSLLDPKSFIISSCVCVRWHALSKDKSLWKHSFKAAVLQIETILSLELRANKFSIFSSELIQSHRLEDAANIASKSNEINKSAGAFQFRSICEQAVRNQNFELAYQMQELAANSSELVGNEAMAYILNRRVEANNFLEICDSLFEQAEVLRTKNNKLGLEVLMQIAFKLASEGQFERALGLTHVIQDRISPLSTSFEAIRPFIEMREHLIYLGQEEWASYCNFNMRFSDLALLRAKTKFIAQLMEKHSFIESPALMPSDPGSDKWKEKCLALIYALIDLKKFDDAKKISNFCIRMEWEHGRKEFINSILKKLKDSGIKISINDWINSRIKTIQSF